jgi:PPM family protein phosphatase
MTRLVGAAASDVGRSRAVNQDGALVAAALFAVADGMGGHRGGEVASSLALRALDAAVGARRTTTLDSVVEAVAAANRAILESSRRDPELAGMGTTLCAVALVEGADGPRVVVANVGDSRVYRLRGDDLVQLTVDHSLVEMMVRQVRLDPAEAASHPQRNIVTRALGIERDLEVDAWELDAVTGDRYLLCSDGLSNELSDDRLAASLLAAATAEAAAVRLVEEGVEAGGRDNATCAVVDVVDAPEDAPDAEGTEGSVFVGAGETLDRASVPPDTTTVRLRPLVHLHSEADVSARPAGAVLAPSRPRARPAPPAAVEPPRRARRSPLRALAFVAAVLAVLVAGAAAVAWYANRTYFVDLHDGRVAIFKGRPEGLLWMSATVAEEPAPPVAAGSLSEPLCDRVLAQQSFIDVEAARDFVDQVRAEAAASARARAAAGVAVEVRNDCERAPRPSR